MTAIRAASMRCKTLADGTLRIELDIEPRDAQDAFRLFGSPGTAVALAAIKPDAPQQERPKGGAAAKWLGQMCNEAAFQMWVAETFEQLWRFAIRSTSVDPPNLAALAADVVRDVCEVQSRAEIDNNPAAFQRFEERIRRPWLEATREKA